jgi:glycosyltransferase involved in cell wall biosynthesis
MARPRDVVFYMPSAAPLLADIPGPAGGAENQVLMLARQLARRGYRVAIVAFGDAGKLRRQVEGVDVIEQSRPATRLPVIRTLAFYRKTYLTLRANRARVLVQRAAGIHTALVALIARLLRCRFVYASAGVHDFDLRAWERKRWIVWAFGIGLRLASLIVVQTEEQARLCRERFGRKALVIKSVAEPAREVGRQPNAFLWIGSVVAYKRPLAFVELARAVPEARFWMVAVQPMWSGEYGLAGELVQAAKTAPNLELLEPMSRAQLGELIERAVAIVSTSRTEGMPNVFLEGWSRGVPALALAHDPDGVLVRERVGEFAGGSAERMVTLARWLWRGRDDRRAQAARCRAYVAREHSPEQIAGRWAKALGLQ